MLDQFGEAPTFVAPGSRLAGDLETLGPLVVCGSVRGDGRIGGALSMAAGSEWNGEVHAQAAVIAGRVTGRLVVEGKLEVGETAVIQADVVARTIAIARGAVIEGAVTVTSGQPALRFNERRRSEEAALRQESALRQEAALREAALREDSAIRKLAVGFAGQ